MHSVMLAVFCSGNGEGGFRDVSVCFLKDERFCSLLCRLSLLFFFPRAGSGAESLGVISQIDV